MNLTGHVTHIRGQHVGLPKLTMRMQVKNNFDAALTVLSANAAVYAKMGNYGGIDEAAHFLGPAAVEIVQNQIGKGAEASWDIVLPIAHHLLLQKIEQLRRGRDLLLLIKVQATLVVTDPADRARLGPFLSTTVNSDSHSVAHCVHRVPKSDWLPVLKDLGYGDYYLIEVPLRGVPHRPEEGAQPSHRRMEPLQPGRRRGSARQLLQKFRTHRARLRCGSTGPKRLGEGAERC